MVVWLSSYSRVKERTMDTPPPRVKKSNNSVKDGQVYMPLFYAVLHMVISKHAKFKGFPFKMSAPEQKRSNKARIGC